MRSPGPSAVSCNHNTYEARRNRLGHSRNRVANAEQA